MLKIDVINYCRKLRLRKTSVKFRPTLIYLVEVGGGMYAHPDCEYLTGGQTAWMTPRLWFQCYGDAKAYANIRPAFEKARVVKLNICAFEEEIKRK